MKGQKKRRKPESVLAALGFTMALALLLSAAGTTLAKYVKSDRDQGLAVAAPFYFTSDKLEPVSGGQYPHYQIDDPGPGEEVQIRFDLSNFADQLRHTGEKIDYTLAVTAGDGGAVAWTGSEASGSLSAGGERTNTVTMTIPRESFGSDQAVTVTAAATAPYEKTIGAQFGFVPRQYGLQWDVREEDGAVVLELAGGSGKEVAVTWADGLIPDPANPALQGASANSAVFTAESGVRYALAFLKQDPGGTYDKASFSVTEGG